MTKNEMNDIRNTRQNLTGFLHFTDIAKLNELFNAHVTVNKQSFLEIADKALELYSAKLLSNKVVSEIFNILKEANKSFRTESHRHDCGSIFEYSPQHNAYIFSKKGTYREFKALNHYID
jgi:hypothetical protein